MCWVLHMPGSASSQGLSKDGEVSALQLDSDSEMGNLETRLNPIRMVNTFYKPSSIFELMYVAVQVNGIGVRRWLT